MNFLNKLNKAKSIKEETVKFDDGTFTVRGMSGDMRDSYDSHKMKFFKMKGKGKNQEPDMSSYDSTGTRALVVAMCLINDETKQRAFSYRDEKTIKDVGEWDGGFLDLLHTAALKASGISEDDAGNAEKN